MEDLTVSNSILYGEGKVKQMKNIKLWPTILIVFFIRFTFFLFRIFPVNSHKVTFASYRSENLSGNLLYIFNEIHNYYPQYKVHFLFKKLNSSLIGKMNYVLHMIKSCYELATSKYFIIDDFYFPVYCIKPKKETEIIQLWHAAGAFKKFGYSTIGKSFGPSEEYLKVVKVHSNYSKVYVSSTEIVPHYAEAFHMSSKQVLPLGVPRTDYFYDDAAIMKSKDRFYQAYPQLKGKKILLYAPTFRGKSHYQTRFDFPLDFALMKEKLGNEYALLIHLHPYMMSDVDIQPSEKDFVYLTAGLFDIQELLAISDVLISDYSSVIFDFSLLGKPIAFIANDLEDYMKERDFYYEFKSFIPGPFFSNCKQLIDWIVAGEFDLDKVVAFRNRFFDITDGKASQRIVRDLLK